MTSALTWRKNSRGRPKGCALQLAPRPELNAPDAPPRPPLQELNHELQKLDCAPPAPHEDNQELPHEETPDEKPAAPAHELSQELERLLDWPHDAPDQEESHELQNACPLAAACQELIHELCRVSDAPAATDQEESHELQNELCAAPGHDDNHEASALLGAPAPGHEASHEASALLGAPAPGQEASHELNAWL